MPVSLLVLQLVFATPFVVWAVHCVRPAVRIRATQEFIAGLPVTVSRDLRVRLERRVTARRVLQAVAMGAVVVILVTVQWFVDGEVLLFVYLLFTAAGAFGRVTPGVVRPQVPQGPVRVATARPLTLRDVVSLRWAAVGVVALLAFVAVDQRLQGVQPDVDPWVDLSGRARILIMLLVPMIIGLCCVPLVLRAVRGSGPATDEAELAAVGAFRRMAVGDVFAAASAAVWWTLITVADSTLLAPWKWTAGSWPLQTASGVLWLLVGAAVAAIASPATGQGIWRSTPRVPLAGNWVDTPDSPEVKEHRACDVDQEKAP